MKRKLRLFPIVILVFLSFSSCERKSGRINGQKRKQNISLEPTVHKTQGKTIIKMTKRDGVYYIPCKINGSNMEFIFDTGASDITMSLTETLFLYKQGTLTNADFVGKQQYQIANGDVEEGTIVKLKTVEIGSLTLKDVQASIINNEKAPLLLGQSALNRFGKISIDYTKSEITFE